jgi:hypothetical protein
MTSEKEQTAADTSNERVIAMYCYDLVVIIIESCSDVIRSAHAF